MSLKLKIDENLPGDLAGLLLAAGHDAVTVGDEDLEGASDERLAKSVRQEARALITLDADFGNIVRFPPASLPGVVFLKLANQAKPHVLAVFRRLVLPRLGAEALDGKLWVVEDARVRVHG